MTYSRTRQPTLIGIPEPVTYEYPECTLAENYAILSARATLAKLNGQYETAAVLRRFALELFRRLTDR